MFKKTLLALAFIGTAVSAQSAVLLSENFNNVEKLGSSGWIFNNASGPSKYNWFQGLDNQLVAQSGDANSFAAANYSSTEAGGTISNWLITPQFSTSTNVLISFWTKAAFLDGFSDSLAFGVSNGSSSLADFVLNSSFTVPVDGWTQYSMTIGPKGDGSMARFAIQYNGLADMANYVGVDTLAINSVPEPTSWLMLGTGLLALASLRRRQQR
jgi:hypothetical protein